MRALAVDGTILKAKAEMQSAEQRGISALTRAMDRSRNSDNSSVRSAALFNLRRLLPVGALARGWAAALCVAAGPAWAAPEETGPVVEDFLKAQTAGLSGKVTITVLAPSSAALPTCQRLQPFLPRGVTPWGRVSVGVRCASERPWTRYVQAHVKVEGEYLVAARAIGIGETLGPQDVESRTGDLTQLPRSVLRGKAQASGMVTSSALAPGSPLRAELLRSTPVIQTGQSVRVLATGPGFSVSTEGKAMNAAAIGAAVQVKTADGRIISGVATEDGGVSVTH